MSAVAIAPPLPRTVVQSTELAPGPAQTPTPRAVQAPMPALPPAAPAAGADLAVLRAMIAGTVPVAEGLLTVARRGGWPIQTAHGYIVAAQAAPGTELRVVGDHNGWRAAPMQRQGDLVWTHLPAPPASMLAPKYALVDGTGEMRADPWARRYTYDAQGNEMSLLASPGRHLERWLAEGGPGVAPRTVRVWVPAGEPTHHMYVHDGQNLFSPRAPWGGWRLQEAAGPHTLIIGIEHGRDRLHELTPFGDRLPGRPPDDALQGGGGDAYADFVQEHLRPRMEARYGRPQRVGVMGSSLGGLMALYQSERHRGAYDFVAALSPTVDWGSFGGGPGAYRERYAEAMNPDGGPMLYLDSGGNPGQGDNYDGTAALAEALLARGWRAHEQLWYRHAPGAPHNEAAWAARVDAPLALFERMRARVRAGGKADRQGG